MGNGFVCDEAVGDDTLFMGSLDHRRFTAFIGSYVTFLAGIAVIDILLHDGLDRSDPDLVDHLCADLV